MIRISPLRLAAILALPLAAHVPHASNTRMETRSASAGLEREFSSIRAGAAAWTGWAVPAVPGHETSCDYSQAVRSPGPVHLEPPDQVRILIRTEQGKIVKIRTISPDCDLDGGGLPFHWFTDVKPADSIALLATMAAENKGAVAAIALHVGDAADQALERFAAPAQPEKLRQEAVFWMGAARGRRGYEALKRIVSQDASEHVRDKAVFALSLSKEPEAVDTLISLAKNDRSAHVRGQALFWLAQKAGKKAAGAISDAVDNDPETEVKKRAVFALQQIPNGEGVPKLIDVARMNKNPAVRKQAMFWLGQSRDPRALAFFEQVLK